jgi:hypothetical protein
MFSSDVKSAPAGSDDGVVACGISSQCINRLTQVECLANECPTRNACQNQRYDPSPQARTQKLVLISLSAFQVPAQAVCQCRDSKDREERVRLARRCQYRKVSVLGVPVTI